jgi:hypothetical protein
MRVLVTGATGYIRGRLIPRLLDVGHHVRVLVRDAARVTARPWSDRVEVVEGDVLDRSSLGPACAGIDAAYYLVHAMCSGDDFAARDRAGAENFVAAARAIGQVIYLGGLVPSGESRRASSVRLEDKDGIIREVWTHRVHAPAIVVFRTFAGLGGRRGWLVWGVGLAAARHCRPARRRPGSAPWPASPDRAVPRRGRGFLAGRGSARTGTAEAARRDEGSRPGMVAVRGGPGTRLDAARSNRVLRPDRLLGMLYWYGIYPIHAVIFSALVLAVAREAEAAAATLPAPSDIQSGAGP